MPQTLDELRKVRYQKLQKLQDQKVPGFPAWEGKRETVESAKHKKLDDSVRIAGRLTAIRGHGKLVFADLTDQSGKLQISFKENKVKNNFELISLLDLGDFISAEGPLYKTESGELTVEVENFNILTKSLRPLPSTWYGFSDVEERYRQRYVDLLVNEEVRRVFETRSKVVRLIRKYLDEKNFLEVETPVLQPLYGGATAKPFITHHNALDMDLYLRVSDELYLKRLIVGGFEKVYELSKDFRNEGIDRQHNPEFTMVEFYWAYANYDDLMNFTEEMLSSIIKEVTGSHKVTYQGVEYDFSTPWKRVTYRDLILQDTGIDINVDNTEEKLLERIKEKKIKLDLEGVIGFAALLDTFYKEVSRPKIVGPMFLIDYPVQMKPLAKKLSSDSTKSGSFQLLVGGFEWINAYNELNDPVDQRERWEEEMKLAKAGLDEYQVLDEDYIRALEYGMPPTAGWGFGIDRFVAFLTNQHTIKDTILFPTMKPDDKIVKEKIPDSKEHEIVKASTDSKPLKMTREQALEILHANMQNQNLRRHCYCVEAVMRALAVKLGGNEDKWGILGLLHDGDYEVTKEDWSKHTLLMIEWLTAKEHGDSELVQALQSHNAERTGFDGPKTSMEWALACCDELSGFIVAVTLVRPDKKLASVDVDSVLKKFPNKEFARAVNRDDITRCEEKLGIPLKEFVEITLTAMKGIASEIGL